MTESAITFPLHDPGKGHACTYCHSVQEKLNRVEYFYFMQSNQ